MSTIETLCKTWIRPAIQALSAYHVPPADNFIKLDAMENPYTWNEELQAEWLSELQKVSINRYPDPSAHAVKAELRHAMQIPDDMDLVLGNGSDELIQMLVLAVGGKDRVLLAPEPSFVMYKMLAQITGMQYQGVPLQASNFALDVDAMLNAIEQYQPALIFLAYPNNPTGNLFERSAVEQIIEAAPGLVVVDEAYCAFTDDSFMNALGRYDNLLVMRTVSKIGLAGLRLGLLVGSNIWLQELEKTRLPYNINVLTQASAIFALKHYEQLLEQTEQIRHSRIQMLNGLQGLSAVHLWQSQTNFILFKVPDAPSTFSKLKENGILIKNLHGSHPLLEHCLRVTIGKPEENRAFLDVLRNAV